MPLPKIATPTYELELPSSGETIRYRPFLVKEEKVLVIALESEDNKEITNAIRAVLKSCVLSKGIKVEKLPTFDIEYLFLNIRGKSVGEEIEVNIICPDDEKNAMAQSFELIATCIDKIYTQDEVWAASDCTKKEMNEFLESMNSTQFKEIEKFFETMPKLSHTIKVTNPKTKKKSEVVLEGLASFFG